MRVLHSIDPVFDEHCRVLILGSFPSVRSREVGFYYGHPQNRFWNTLFHIFGGERPRSIEEKRAFLLANGIALWDVIASCEISGSSDASIKGAVPNDLSALLARAPIERIFTNGGTAHKLYQTYLFSQTGIPDIPLPSTSPANAAWTQERLDGAWRVILKA